MPCLAQLACCLLGGGGDWMLALGAACGRSACRLSIYQRHCLFQLCNQCTSFVIIHTPPHSFGVFCSLVFVGCVTGAIGVSCTSRARTLFFLNVASNVSLAEQPARLSALSSSNLYYAAGLILGAADFLCLSVAKLMMLQRLLQFGFVVMSRNLQSKLLVLLRCAAVVVVVVNLLGLCCSAASAALHIRISAQSSEVAARYAQGDVVAAAALEQQLGAFLCRVFIAVVVKNSCVGQVQFTPQPRICKLCSSTARRLW